MQNFALHTISCITWSQWTSDLLAADVGPPGTAAPLISSNRLSIAARLSNVDAVSIALLVTASLWSLFISASVHTKTRALQLFTTNHLQSWQLPSQVNADESRKVALQSRSHLIYHTSTCCWWVISISHDVPHHDGNSLNHQLVLLIVNIILYIGFICFFYVENMDFMTISQGRWYSIVNF